MSFRLIFELDPPRAPDLKKVMLQLETMGPVVDAILIPDNHLGRPALSSIALAIEVIKGGFKPVVALNARDRNPLRLQSDLLTLRAYGIEETLFLFGDSSEAPRTGLTVKQMLADENGDGLRRGVVATVARPLGWRRNADFLVTKLDFGRSKAGYWRESEGFKQPLYCGVIALSDRALAEKVFNNIPDMTPPPDYLEAFDNDSEAGFNAALAELDELHRSGVDGAHIVVPAGRRRFAERLREWKKSVSS